jgi:hypothetical protein
MYVQQNTAQATTCMSRRCHLTFDAEDVVDANDPQYCFSAEKNYLDFLLLIGRNVGVEVFLPSHPTPGFMVTLNLKLPIKQFYAKYGTLGFDPAGAILYIGQNASEDLWIAMAPNQFFEDSSSRTGLNKSEQDRRLTGRHYRIMVIFLSWILTKLDGRGFYLFDMYDFDLDSISPNFERNSNIM